MHPANQHVYQSTFPTQCRHVCAVDGETLEETPAIPSGLDSLAQAFLRILWLGQDRHRYGVCRDTAAPATGGRRDTTVPATGGRRDTAAPATGGAQGHGCPCYGGGAGTRLPLLRGGAAARLPLSCDFSNSLAQILTLRQWVSDGVSIAQHQRDQSFLRVETILCLIPHGRLGAV
ncbi:MAG: hypothetical protein KatS3mg019_0443 [Fimbriimonadales bacterium]|nr:MAG: hypothetical protein KatS3mg019_0443 [Fimbriimonadales bacterium]